MLLQRNY